MGVIKVGCLEPCANITRKVKTVGWTLAESRRFLIIRGMHHLTLHSPCLQSDYLFVS